MGGFVDIKGPRASQTQNRQPIWIDHKAEEFGGSQIHFPRVEELTERSVAVHVTVISSRYTWVGSSGASQAQSGAILLPGTSGRRQSRPECCVKSRDAPAPQ